MAPKAALKAAKRGFTLVEMAIVLVIIGLLAGGVVAGKNLIRSAKLKTITSEFSMYQKAIQTFNDQYMELPGDMSRATEFWGAANTGGAGGECASIETNTGTGTQTCNGNGNGRIGYGVGTEQFRFWQHLVNAGLIKGNYTGVQGSTNTHHITGENAPQAQVDGAGWAAMSLPSTFVGDATWFNLDEYGNLLTIGSTWNGNGIHYDTFLTPKEAFNIDSKIDDGEPANGKVIAHLWNECTDATSKDMLTASYLLSDNSELCALAFLKAF